MMAGDKDTSPHFGTNYYPNPPEGVQQVDLPPIRLDRTVEVPVTRVREERVEVPHIQYVERIEEVPHYVTYEKDVPRPTMELVHRTVEIPKYVQEERFIEVPQIQIVDKVEEVVQYIPQEKIIERPKIMLQERIIPVPKRTIEEKIVEVPREEFDRIMLSHRPSTRVTPRIGADGLPLQDANGNVITHTVPSDGPPVSYRRNGLREYYSTNGELLSVDGSLFSGRDAQPFIPGTYGYNHDALPLDFDGLPFIGPNGIPLMPPGDLIEETAVIADGPCGRPEAVTADVWEAYQNGSSDAPQRRYKQQHAEMTMTDLRHGSTSPTVQEIVEVPHVQHLYRNIMQPEYRHIPKPVEVSLAHYQPNPVHKTIRRNVPVPVELEVVQEFICPRIVPIYKEVPVPVYVKRQIERPVPADAMFNTAIMDAYLNDGIRERSGLSLFGVKPPTAVLKPMSSTEREMAGIPDAGVDQADKRFNVLQSLGTFLNKAPSGNL
eukprot:Lankesteria_metandrocarpae@DN2865_c0_g1_i1.p1